MMTISMTVGLPCPTSSEQPSNLSMYMPKRVGDRRQPCLTLYLQLVSYDQPLVFLNLIITFSYNFIALGTLNSSNLFQRLLLISI
jgi:hypothetical protein